MIDRKFITMNIKKYGKILLFLCLIVFNYLFSLKINNIILTLLLFYLTLKLYMRHTNSKFRLFYHDNNINRKIIHKCPLISSKKYVPTIWLPFAFLQTLYDQYIANLSKDFIIYNKRNIMLENMVQYSLDIVELNLSNKHNNLYNSTIKTNHSIIVIIPGLTSENSDTYIKQTCYDILKTQKYKVIILNNRWNGDTLSLRNNQFANISLDIKYFVNWLLKEYLNHDIYFVAFSYGANTLINYLGKYCNIIAIKACVAISAPFCITCVDNNIKTTIYENALVNGSKQIIKKLKNEIMNSPVLFNFDYKSLNEIKTMKDIGREFTSKFLGYSSVNEYYEKESCEKMLSHVKTPLLCINAEDDPIVNFKKIPINKIINNPNIIMIMTKNGSHIGFFHEFKPQRWFTKVILEYFSLF